MYGLADLAAPCIQFRGTLGDCYRTARGMALCGIYRETAARWITVAVRYYDRFTHVSRIVTTAPQPAGWVVQKAVAP